jgi:AmiR/NasT family two-component response regulator
LEFCDGDDDLIRAQQEIAGLTAAVQSNRVIGVALGILVERHDISPETAFAYLRRLSQDNNRKLRDLAEELVRSGTLDLLSTAPVDQNQRI